jgi:hypothetical protein
MRILKVYQHILAGFMLVNILRVFYLEAQRGQPWAQVDQVEARQQSHEAVEATVFMVFQYTLGRF